MLTNLLPINLAIGYLTNLLLVQNLIDRYLLLNKNLTCFQNDNAYSNTGW